MAYIKAHYQHSDAVFLKEELKFKQGKYVYGEISFNYSSSFEGVMSYDCVYNKEMGDFFAANLPPYQKPKDSYDMVFLQNSIQGAHYYQAPPLTVYPHGDAVKLPETEAEAEPIYADVLQHLQQYHIHHPRYSRMQRRHAQILGSVSRRIPTQSADRRLHRPPPQSDRR